MLFKNAAAHAEALAKVAAADKVDAVQAWEAGFIKAAVDMGLNEAEFLALRAKADESK